MKKVFTLIASFILVASSFAQYNSGNQKRYPKDKGNDIVYNKNKCDKHNDRYDDNDNFSARERDRQIEMINRNYDRQIRDVQNKWFVSRSKKERAIWNLERDRNTEIEMVYAKYNRENDRGRKRRRH